MCSQNVCTNMLLILYRPIIIFHRAFVKGAQLIFMSLIKF